MMVHPLRPWDRSPDERILPDLEKNTQKSACASVSMDFFFQSGNDIQVNGVIFPTSVVKFHSAFEK